MKGSYCVLLFFVVCLLAGLFSYEKIYLKKKTYGYYKETISKENNNNTNQNQIEQETIVTSLEVLTEQNPEQEQKKEEKKVFLTFDDGPSEITETILDTLKQYDIKATFFMIGEQITEDKEELVKKMVEQGHEIGVHTYTHEKDEIYASAQAYIEDVVKTSKRIEEVIGKKPVYYRFPWGSVNNYICSFRKEIIDTLAASGYQYIDWNVSGEDSVGCPSIQMIYSNIKRDYNKYNEPVVLMHDSQSNQMTAEALSDIIKLFQDAGYEFGSIGERSKPYQWCREES